MKSTAIRFVVVALLMAATALWLQARPSAEVFPPRQPLASMPMKVGPWSGEDLGIDQETLDVLGHGEFLRRGFVNVEQPQNAIELFVAYFPSQKTGDTIHSPNHCLQGAGWVPLQKSVIQIPGSNGTSFPATRYVTAYAGQRQLVIFWFQAHDRELANEYLAKYYLVADAMKMNRTDGALVRLVTDMDPGESPDSAQARLLSLGSKIIPDLDTYIPR